MSEITGLLVDVYKSADGCDCTNGGQSAWHNRFILTGEGVEGHFSPREDAPELVLTKGLYGSIRAVPRKLLDSKAWVMFGGNFVYSCDGKVDISIIRNGTVVATPITCTLGANHRCSDPTDTFAVLDGDEIVATIEVAPGDSISGVQWFLGKQ